jgi:hypothetical protein
MKIELYKRKIELPITCGNCMIANQCETTGIWYCLAEAKIIRCLLIRPDWCSLEEVEE